MRVSHRGSSTHQFSVVVGRRQDLPTDYVEVDDGRKRGVVRPGQQTVNADGVGEGPQAMAGGAEGRASHVDPGDRDLDDLVTSALHATEQLDVEAEAVHAALSNSATDGRAVKDLNPH
jgi:hypothetical protein